MIAIEYLFDLILLLGMVHFTVVILQLFLSLFFSPDPGETEDTGVLASEKRVVVLIPVCNEDPLILENTLLKCKDLENCTEIVVIENSSIDSYKRSLLAVCDELGVNSISIPNLGNKARALNCWLRENSDRYDYVALLDVDQQPERDFITTILPFFEKDEKLSLVQTPQAFRNANTNIISFLYSCMQMAYFDGISDARSRLKFSTCFGTNCMVRTDILRKVGFFDEECVIEDIATSYRIHALGYSLRYVKKHLVKGLAPTNIKGLMTQMKRYVIGSNQMVYMIIKDILSGGLRRSNPYLLASYLHSTASLSIAGLVLYVSVLCYFFSDVPAFFYLLKYLYPLFLILLLIRVRHIRVVLGNFFFLLLTPFFLIHTFRFASYNSIFCVTPKEEEIEDERR